jgi:hypothetical protein
MGVQTRDLRLFGSATMPDDDTTTAIGGAEATSKRVVFADFGGGVQVVSSDAGDTTQSVTIYYRDGDRVLQNEVQGLNGQTPEAYTATPIRLLRALKSATCAGDVAVESITPVRLGTAQDGDTGTITLDADASEQDDIYNGLIVRLDDGQIREIVDYDGATKEAAVNYDWVTPPDSSSVFILSRGMLFESGSGPAGETLEVRRILYDVEAGVPGVAAVKRYEKVFWKNLHGADDVSEAVIAETVDEFGVFAFGLAPTLNDTATNGTGNTRLTAPPGIVFSSAEKNVANGGILTAGDSQAVWIELTLLGGEGAFDANCGLELSGVTPE